MTHRCAWTVSFLLAALFLPGSLFAAGEGPQQTDNTGSGQAESNPPSISAVVNGASFLPGAISPGSIVTIFGTGFGPAEQTDFHLTTDGRVDTTLAGTRVLFDGVPAPLMQVSARQITALMPYEMAGKSNVSCVVEYRSARSDAANTSIAKTAPGIFTRDSSGIGQAVVLNQDGSANSASDPAARGSVVTFRATGEGQTDPPGVDGKIAKEVLPKPLAPVWVTIDGFTATVVSAGAWPGEVAGTLQVKARVPELATSGPLERILLTIGDATSQSGVTLAVR
jgi:uncharacterized protein (TIGR03437 family)